MGLLIQNLCLLESFSIDSKKNVMDFASGDDTNIPVSKWSLTNQGCDLSDELPTISFNHNKDVRKEGWGGWG